MKVQQVMQQDVRSCSVDDRLSAAAQVMWENDCGCVPVCAADGRLVGMITDRDICMATFLQGKAPDQIGVAGVMSADVHSCRAEANVGEVEALMGEHQVRRVPVVDGEQHLLGIVSLNDLACAADGARGRHHPGLTDVGTTLRKICRPRCRHDDQPVQVAV